MSQKFENLLNLALETPLIEREQTEDLNIGYDSAKRTWELIVKYNGTLERLSNMGIEVEELIAGYAILVVPEDLVEAVASFPEIEYVEKPKRYFYSQIRPTDTSCIAQVEVREPYLSGQGVIIGVLDSGIDYRLQEFRKEDGSTRILYLYDQTTEKEYDSEAINRALNAETMEEGFLLVPSRDVSGHGTAVAGICAGSRSPSYSGVAYNAGFIIVKLGTQDPLGFPRTTQIMRGVTYALKKARENNAPLVINLSFGNSYGAHDGSSLLERFLDNAAEIGRTVICVGSGNEGNAAGHFEGNVEENRQVELAVGAYERNLSVQLWKNYGDFFRITLQSPGGQSAVLGTGDARGKYTMELEGNKILVYFGEPTPYGVAQEIYLEFIPLGTAFITEGIWRFVLEPISIAVGQYYMYLPGGAVLNEMTGFFGASPQVTLTIPSTAAKVITVGAYDSVFESYADFSGRGYETIERTIGVVTAGLVKPDVAAPGVNILAPAVYGGYIPVTGTSFATPIVSGSCALLMEWGIVKGKDPFLYGEKVKAYLRKGARPIRGESVYPNAKVGFGAICVTDSL